VEPRRVEVQASLVRIDPSVDGKPLLTAAHQPTAITPNTLPVTFSAGIGDGLTLSATVTPRLNDDKTVMVNTELRLTRGYGTVSVQTIRRMALNKVFRAAWLPNVFEPNARNAPLLGMPEPEANEPGVALLLAFRALDNH